MKTHTTRNGRLCTEPVVEIHERASLNTLTPIKLTIETTREELAAVVKAAGAASSQFTVGDIKVDDYKLWSALKDTVKPEYDKTTKY